MNTVTYPKDLENSESLIIQLSAFKMAPIDVITYSGKKQFSNKDYKGEPCGVIVMALPSATLTESFSSSWNIDNIFEKVNSTAVAQAAQMFTSAMLPPVYKATYSSTSPRSYNFTFSFLPKNREETEDVVKIIKMLKQWTAPGTLLGSNDSFNSSTMGSIIPYVLEIKFRNGAEKLQELIKPLLCIIENISVSYFDNGQITAYYDGMPKSTSVSLSVKEVTVPTRDDFN